MQADTKLLFIISQPRSGSTLLQSVISNNRYVSTTSEPWILLPFMGLFNQGLTKARYNYEWMQNGMNEFVRKHIGEELFKTKLKDFLRSLYGMLETSDTIYVLDKTPRYYEILNLIIDFFPDARFVILKRNPFAVASSIIKTWNINSIDKLSQYEGDLLNAPSLIQNFVREYRSAENLLEVHYEDIVKNPVGSFRQIYDWLDLTFSEDVLDYSRNNKLAGTYGDQVGIKKHSRPGPRSENEWKLLLGHPFWGAWLKGYSAYLGSRGISEYGEYEQLSDRLTDEFKYYLFVCSRKTPKRYHLPRELKGMMKYLYYRSKFGEPTKNWRITESGR